MAPGRHALGLGERRDGVLFVPARQKPGSPVPLVVMLHGAGGSATGALRPFEALADEHGFVLLAPESRAMSWDVRFGPFGPDVEFIDRALARVFRHCAIDPARMAVEGFSDGASYALSLGLTNGDLFRRVVAFSPGFMELTDPAGKPPVFVSHGTRDRVLAIDRTSRVLVPRLRRAGYQVEYKEFDGGHTVPREIAAEAAAWLAVP
jgi:phospholipase/carboxylesterase